MGRAGRDPQVVSYNMSRIRSKNTLLELQLECALQKARLRAKRHLKVFGNPDFAFPRLKIAIFCDSHFWHGYRWNTAKNEFKRKRSFWVTKIERNRARDRRVNRELRRAGWIVL